MSQKKAPFFARSLPGPLTYTATLQAIVAPILADASCPYPIMTPAQFTLDQPTSVSDVAGVDPGRVADDVWPGYWGIPLAVPHRSEASGLTVLPRRMADMTAAVDSAPFGFKIGTFRRPRAR